MTEPEGHALLHPPSPPPNASTRSCHRGRTETPPPRTMMRSIWRVNPRWQLAQGVHVSYAAIIVLTPPLTIRTIAQQHSTVVPGRPSGHPYILQAHRVHILPVMRPLLKTLYAVVDRPTLPHHLTSSSLHHAAHGPSNHPHILAFSHQTI